MAPRISHRSELTKVQDERHYPRCRSGHRGTIRIQAWADQAGRIVKYEFAFIHHLLCSADNGRVVGYDNAHGVHERHWKGSVVPVTFVSFEQTLSQFLQEVEELKANS